MVLRWLRLAATLAEEAYMSGTYGWLTCLAEGWLLLARYMMLVIDTTHFIITPYEMLSRPPRWLRYVIEG